MRKPKPTSRPCGHVLHTDPHLYVLARYAPRPDEPDYCRASCEALDAENPELGNGLVFYLSPFDAHLDAAFRSGPGEPFHVVPAVAFDPREMICEHGGKLHYFLHFGWCASDGKLVMRRQGSLASVYLRETLHVPPAKLHAIDLTIRTDDLAHHRYTREQAGLYAYTETFEQILALDERSRRQQVGRAIENMPERTTADAQVNQLAMYDPEAAQWHFIPFEVFVSRLGEGRRTA